MTQDLRVALVTSLKDQLVGPLRRSLDEVEKNLKAIEKDLAGVTQGSNQAARAMSGIDGPAQASRQVADLARNTENAVKLADRLKSAWSTAGNMVRGVTTGIAAFQAAKYVVSAPMQQARNYDVALAHASNTAFSDRDLAGRKAGMGELNAAVETAVRAGGGTRDDALQGLQKLLANGISFEQAKATMPQITKAATASGASTVEISEIVTKLLKDGFDPKVIQDAIGKAIAAGQAGSFEMKDMAQWIPKLLAGGKMSGQRGMADYERMLAMAQVSTNTAGGSAESGNNLLNFLLKINSADTANDAKKLGIDLAGSLAAARAKGVSAPEAFMELLRKTSDADPRMVKLRQQFAGASGDKERMESLKAQESILQGSSIGKLVQDRQALMPIIALLNMWDEYKRTLGVVQVAGAKTTEGNHALISDTVAYRTQQADNEKLFAQTRGVSGVNEALAKLSDATVKLYQKYPDYADAVEAAKLALSGLAAAAGAAGLAGLLLGGGKVAALVGAGKAAGAAVAATAAGSAGLYAAGGAAPVAAASMSGTALAAGVGGGLVLAGGAVLGAGYLMSESLNSDTGLRARIDSRQARIAELVELANLTRQSGGSQASLEKMDSEIASLRRDRDALLTKLVDSGEVVREIRALQNRPIQVSIDGREVAATTNSHNEFVARRN